jgi:hypothetical protein
VANKIASDLAHLFFDSAIGVIDWGSAMNGALAGAAGNIEPNFAAMLSYLGHELVPARSFIEGTQLEVACSQKFCKAACRIKMPVLLRKRRSGGETGLEISATGHSCLFKTVVAKAILRARWGDFMPTGVDANHKSFGWSNCARHQHHRSEGGS